MLLQILSHGPVVYQPNTFKETDGSKKLHSELISKIIDSPSSKYVHKAPALSWLVLKKPEARPISMLDIGRLLLV